MKTFKENIMDSLKPQQLQDVDSAKSAYPLDSQTVTDLEFIMTKSAFGYQYAIDALEQVDQNNFDAEQAMNEVESFKKAYFLARQKLKQIDNDRLAKLEEDLRIQKMSVFGLKQNYLH